MPRTKNIKRNIGFDPITDERVRKLALANYPRPGAPGEGNINALIVYLINLAYEQPKAFGLATEPPQSSNPHVMPPARH